MYLLYTISKSLLKIFIIFLFSISYLSPQTKNTKSNEEINRLSRYRLSFGGVTLISEDINYDFQHFFFNLSFRSSGFNRYSSSFKIKLAFELGVNGLIVARENFSKGLDHKVHFVPYTKFGPEARIIKNLHLGVSLGLVFASYTTSYNPLPFAGLNCFYLFEVSNHLYLEFETGFHFTFSPGTFPYLVYLTAGISVL